MVGQLLSNTNENATVYYNVFATVYSATPDSAKLNKALIAGL
jgi:hypothetical protein